MTGPPTEGFSVPQFPTARRVPTDFPIVPRPPVGPLLGVLLGALFVGDLLIWSWTGGPHASSGENRRLFLIASGVLLLALLPLGGMIIVTIVSGPPMAVTPAGVWVLVRPGRAVYLPWASAGRVVMCRRLRGGDYLLSVLPPGPVPVRLGVLTRFVQWWRQRHHRAHASALMVITGTVPDLIWEMLRHYPSVPRPQPAATP